jgi:hypothetical protein
MPQTQTVLKISRKGTITAIYSDELAGLIDQGRAEIRRASHVEPTEGGWAADLAPVGGPILGPFKLRQDALQAEVAWLNRWLSR